MLRFRAAVILPSESKLRPYSFFVLSGVPVPGCCSRWMSHVLQGRHPSQTLFRRVWSTFEIQKSVSGYHCRMTSAGRCDPFQPLGSGSYMPGRIGLCLTRMAQFRFYGQRLWCLSFGIALEGVVPLRKVSRLYQLEHAVPSQKSCNWPFLHWCVEQIIREG
jgi:hypothetical protein